MTTKREARIRAMMEGPAGPPAADVLAPGATFTIVLVEGEEWDLVWFQAEVAPLKREIVKLLLDRHTQSQHTWGGHEQSCTVSDGSGRAHSCRAAGRSIRAGSLVYHAPGLEVAPLWHFLKTDPSTREIEYRCRRAARSYGPRPSCQPRAGS